MTKPRTNFKEGDQVRWVGNGDPDVGRIRSVTDVGLYFDWTIKPQDGHYFNWSEWDDSNLELIGSDPVSPDHYKFPGGAEVIDISEHLTSNGGQVVQYVARATRLDGHIKGEALEDLKKASFFLQREIDRLGTNK